MTSEASATADSSYSIRQASISDGNVLAHHRAAMFRDMGSIDDMEAVSIESASRTSLAMLMQSNEYVAWVAESSQREVVAGGGIMIRRMLPRAKNLNGGYEAHILNVYVEIPHRRRGLASKLIVAMLEWCKAQDISRISLHASPAGRSVYEKLGFKPTNEMRYEP